MDTSGIAALATSLNQSRTAEVVQFSVLKKAMDMSAQNGLQLIQVASQVVPNNPPHLGNRIDTMA